MNQARRQAILDRIKFARAMLDVETPDLKAVAREFVAILDLMNKPDIEPLHVDWSPYAHRRSEETC